MRALWSAAGIVLVLATPASAFDCTGWSTSTPEITLDGSVAGGPTYYVDVICGALGLATNHAVGCGDGAIWVYEESNGISGQQRRDEVRNDTCHGLILGDTIVF